MLVHRCDGVHLLYSTRGPQVGPVATYPAPSGSLAARNLHTW